MLQTALSRSWHASWWEWHVLILGAFGLVAYAARREWREERFSALYMTETARGLREVSVVFADLSGFTSFSEGRDPAEVSEMLNAYFERAIPPIVSKHGGDVERLMGDALMATFNTRGDQPDHAERAAAAALAIRDSTAAVAARAPGLAPLPGRGQHRRGVGRRSRRRGRPQLHGDRRCGQFRLSAGVAGAGRRGGDRGGDAAQAAGARTRSLGSIEVKGRREPLDAYVLESLDRG